MAFASLKDLSRDATNTISQRHVCPYRSFLKGGMESISPRDCGERTQCNRVGFSVGWSLVEINQSLEFATFETL